MICQHAVVKAVNGIGSEFVTSNWQECKSKMMKVIVMWKSMWGRERENAWMTEWRGRVRTHHQIMRGWRSRRGGGRVWEAGKERAMLSNRCLTCPGSDVGWGEEVCERERGIEGSKGDAGICSVRQVLLDQFWWSLYIQGPVNGQATSRQPAQYLQCI